MLMWLTGFLVVPFAREWSGLPFLFIALGLLFAWICAYGSATIPSTRRRELQGSIERLAAEEAIVGAITGPLAGVQLAWNFTIGYQIPAWAPWLALAAGLCLLGLARLHTFPGEWLLPVRGRWRRMSLAAVGILSLHLAGPCWIFLFELWRFNNLGSGGPQVLAARCACMMLGVVVVLYSSAFVLHYGCREALSFELDAERSLSSQAS